MKETATYPPLEQGEYLLPCVIITQNHHIYLISRREYVGVDELEMCIFKFSGRVEATDDRSIEEFPPAFPRLHPAFADSAQFQVPDVDFWCEIVIKANGLPRSTMSGAVEVRNVHKIHKTPKVMADAKAL